MSTLSRRQVEERVKTLIPAGERCQIGLHCRKGKGVTSWKVRAEHHQGALLYAMFNGKIMSIELIEEEPNGID